jgi:putative membrane protein
MTILLTLWTWYPSILIGCAALITGYLYLVNFRPARKFILFLCGILILLIALDSPLDVLGDTYLFSAHMLQHQLLILAVPPLLLAGIPEEAARRGERWIRQALKRSGLQRLESSASPARGIKPTGYILLWLVGTATIWLWHIPALYNAALADENIHVVEHLSFLFTATLFWWPILSPLPEQRLSSKARFPSETTFPPLPQAAYLLLALVACDILGTLLAYSPPGLYPAYLKPDDVYGILPLLRDRWGMTPSIDQQAGGLLMGLTADPVYILFALSAMARWYNTRRN